MGTRFFPRVAFLGVIFLFFLQLLTEFIEAIYSFGLCTTGLVTDAATILFLFSPLLLLLFSKGAPRCMALTAGEIMLACRVFGPMLATRHKMYICGVGAACFLILFPSLLRARDRDDRAVNASYAIGGLTFALLLSILFRAMNSGADISTWGPLRAVGWILAIAAAGLLPFILKADLKKENIRVPGGSGARSFGACIGIMSVFLLLYFAFESPNVIARWTEASHLYVIAMLVVSITGFTMLVRRGRPLGALLGRAPMIVWNIIFIASLSATLRLHQTPLPDIPSLYPIPATTSSLAAEIALAVMLISFPVVLADFGLFIREIETARIPSRILAIGFAIGALYFILMTFSHIFTTVYDYIPVIGPYFRDKFWAVHLVAGLGVFIPALFLRKETFAASDAWSEKFSGALVILLSASCIMAYFLVSASPKPTQDSPETLRVFTYNIQQGYSEGGERNFDAQLDVLRGANPDVIGLQECDTNRIADGNNDIPRYFADKLNMYCYYGPSPVSGTFGVAILSKYPLKNPRTVYLYSHSPGHHEKEQTAAATAQITVGEKTFDVVVTHLGNSGPAIQMQAAIDTVKGRDNIIVMGDFNSRPDEEGYKLATSILKDSWLQVGGGKGVGREVAGSRRIDHIFVSDGVKIKNSRYFTGSQSDHPSQMTEIALEGK
jgi:endonuclease/exonuclease/phosphatase family metal-dependent hydrolase